MSGSNRDSLVLRLMEPYLSKGHHLDMDNYHNSIDLSLKSLEKKLMPLELFVLIEMEVPKMLLEQNLK